jgi:hypothetical protein
MTKTTIIGGKPGGGWISSSGPTKGNTVIQGTGANRGYSGTVTDTNTGQSIVSVRDPHGKSRNYTVVRTNTGQTITTCR